MSASLLSGTVTFLFCDIEGSTRLWEKHPAAMQVAQARHDQILRTAIETHQGHLVKTTGDGFHVVFPTALDGLLAAFSAQQALCSDTWPEIQPDVLRSRMALSTGEAVAREDDYYGTAVNRAARLMAVGHGGQILLSSTTAELVQDRLPDGIRLLDLGDHRMRDLIRPEHIYQVGHPTLRTDFPPLNSLEAFPNNLPVQLTSFIGRRQEITDVKELVHLSRLITLIGPGGTGKTRLALQASADLLIPGEVSLFPHGVWLVEFAPQNDPNLVEETLAEVFHLREMSNGPPLIEMIINYLRAKQLLLILDNCEHLIEACARLADQLLHACPGIKILASSREAFGIMGEMIYRVPSLSIPQQERQHSPASAQRSAPGTVQAADAVHIPVEKLMQYEAVQLFVERAAAAQPRFSLNDRNAPAVIRICQRLDGIPLALELAAARIQVFTPEQIAARLDDRFRLLTGGSRTALHRQQTLRALIDWSYDMLTAPEQALLRLLSVFTGGWRYEAAEAVSGSPDVLDLLTSLVNKSLVIVNEQGSETRYSFLETIRQYARDKLLESGEAAQARDRHLAYYVQISVSADENIAGSAAIEWMDQMDLEAENIRTAVEWAMESRPEDALRLIGNLYLYCVLRMNLREFQQLAREALSRVEKQHAGDPAELEIVQLKARGLMAFGMFTMNLGELSDSRVILEESIALARSIPDPIILHMALGILSVACNILNDLNAAKEAAQESLSLSRSMRIDWAVGMSLGTLAWAEGKLGNDERRSTLLRELSALTTSLENPMIFDTQMLLGMEARAYGDLTGARIILEQCLKYLPVLRSVSFEAIVRSELAHIQRESGDLAAARAAYCQTMQLWINVGHRAAIAHQLECFGFIALAEQQYPRAARLFGAAEFLRETLGRPMTDPEMLEYQKEVQRLRQALPEQDFEREWSGGYGMSMEDAITFALAS